MDNNQIPMEIGCVKAEFFYSPLLDPDLASYSVLVNLYEMEYDCE